MSALLSLDNPIYDLRMLATLAGVGQTEGFNLADSKMEQDMNDWLVRQTWLAADRLQEAFDDALKMERERKK